MKLDFDCVREVLLVLEEISVMQDNHMFKPLTVNDFMVKISDYSENEVLYTLQKLLEADYINAVYNYDTDLPFNKTRFFIQDLTYSGHEYLNTIRDNTVWKQIKEKTPTLTFEIIKKAALALLPF